MQTKVSIKKPFIPVILLLAWLVPGSGHFLAGKKHKALFFFLMLTGTYTVGLCLGGRSFFLDRENYFTFLAFLGILLNGAIYFISLVFGLFRDNLLGIYYDAGVIYTIIPGLLNFLVVLDAYDYLSGKKV